MIKYKAMTESPMWSVMLALVAFSHLLIQKYKKVDIMSQGIINISIASWVASINEKEASQFKSSISKL